MIIGLIGKKRSGKSTTTNHLISKYGFDEILWAYPLKEIIGRELFGLTDEQIYGGDEHREVILPEWGMSSRQILQIVGTDMFRKYWPDFWVKIGIRRIQKLLSTNPDRRIVVSDCRFPNEVEAIKALGGITMRIVRKDLISTDTHPSETSLDYYEADRVIVSGEGVENLKRLVDLHMTEILNNGE